MSGHELIYEWNDLLLWLRMDSHLLKPRRPRRSFRPVTQAPKQRYATACMKSDLHIVFPHPCS